jgi:hypothetical protein
VNWLDRLGCWWQDRERPEAQQVFLDEIAERRQPTTPRERSQQWRAGVRPSWAWLGGSTPSLAASATAGRPCFLGDGLIAAAPPPQIYSYFSPKATWPRVPLTLGLLGLVIDAACCPHQIHLGRFAALAAAPIAVAGWPGVPALSCRNAANVIDHVSFLGLRAGMILIALVIVGGDGTGAAMFWRDHDGISCAGCASSSVGAATVCFGPLPGRPGLA